MLKNTEIAFLRKAAKLIRHQKILLRRHLGKIPVFEFEMTRSAAPHQIGDGKMRGRPRLARAHRPTPPYWPTTCGQACDSVPNPRKNASFAPTTRQGGSGGRCFDHELLEGRQNMLCEGARRAESCAATWTLYCV